MAEFPLPANVADLTGIKVGRLTVTGWSFNKNARRHWVCDCSCGGTVAVRHDNLVNETTKSCGCIVSERARRLAAEGTEKNATHRRTYTPEYRAWQGMLGRCKPDFTYADNYFERGITVCNEWTKFEAFYAYMGDKPSPDHTLERIDNDKGYEPGNVKWASYTENIRNRRNSINPALGDRKLALIEWAAELNLSYKIMYRRHKEQGWPISKIISHYGVDYPLPPE